jgi:D-serine deaminase-like pyridoxal phosphate-dependent protein
MTTVQSAVEALRQDPLPGTDKALGRLATGRLAAAGPVTAARLAQDRPSLFDPELAMPVMVLREADLAHNIAAMAGYCADAGVRLAPHGKTTMAPQLFARQLEAGAWGICAANLSQVRLYREFGVARVLVANEVADPAAVGWLAAEMAADPGFDCYVYADSPDGVRLLEDGLRDGGGDRRPLPVLVELGQPGGRGGCRSVGEALAVASAVTASPVLRLAGVAGYEGSIGHDREPATLAAVAGFCRELRALAGLLPPVPAGQDDYLVTVGGSAFFDVVVDELTAEDGSGPTPPVVLRSGAYVSHDHGFYARLSPGVQPGGAGRGPALRPALEVWTRVLSAPEPGLAIADAGRREAPVDQGPPVPLRVRRPGGETADATGMRVARLDDEHAYLRVPPGNPLRPGDLVCLGISHPCTAFDKWPLIPVVDEAYRIVDVVRTFF